MYTNKSPLERMAQVVDTAYRIQERRKQNLLHMVKLMQTPTRTPFEQAAYDEQFRTRNRVSGPELTSTFTPNINETKSDYDILVAILCLVAFIILIICVSNNA